MTSTSEWKTLHRVDVDEPFERGGSHFVEPAFLRVTLRPGFGTQPDDVILTVGHRTIGAEQSVLLNRSTIAIIAHGLAHVAEPEASGEIEFREDGAGNAYGSIQTVTMPDGARGWQVEIFGYGHSWKRRQVTLTDERAEALRQVLVQWLGT